jgi:chromosome segregation ATPase
MDKILNTFLNIFSSRSQSLENSNSNYVKTISEMETTIMKQQQSDNDLKQKLEYAKNETRDANNELQQYRLRAQNQLQLKEKMIEQLKSGTGVIVNGNETAEANLQIELDQLRDQRDHLQSELNLLSRRLEESRTFIEKMEHKHRMMISESEDKIASLDETINQLTLTCSRYEDEMRLQKQEISQIRDEMLKQKTAMTTKLHEKFVENLFIDSISFK